MLTKRLTVLFLCSTPTICQVALAEPQLAVNSATRLSAILPPLEQSEFAHTQEEVFNYLLGKTGRLTTLPNYPQNALLNWTQENYRTAGDDSRKMYWAIAQHLRAAQPLLSHQSQQQNLRGLRVAYDASLKAAVQLKDRGLCAQIFEAFILPHLNATRSEANDLLSKQKLLQNAANAYRLANESSKQVAVLHELVSVAEAAGNISLADWAHIKLAEVLEAHGRYKEAIDNLQAVQSPNLMGSKKWIPELQKKLQNQEQKQQTPELTK